jgi:hypothetical protein
MPPHWILEMILDMSQIESIINVNVGVGVGVKS